MPLDAGPAPHRAPAPDRARQVWGWFVRHRALSLGVACVAAACFAFAEIAELVAEEGARGFDRAVLLALRNPADANDPLGPRWLEEVARDVTALGSHVVLIGLVAGVAGYLLLSARRRTALFVAAAVGSGALLSAGLKLGYARPRPDLVPHAVTVYSASFPSGHAMLSALAYLTLGALLMRVEPRRRTKAYILSLAVLVAAAVGLSRVYLGVHWPTDVLAGWVAGAGWALLCWLVMTALQRRGGIEPEPPARP